jgi:hypothetical protein
MSSVKEQKYQKQLAGIAMWVGIVVLFFGAFMGFSGFGAVNRFLADNFGFALIFGIITKNGMVDAETMNFILSGILLFLGVLLINLSKVLKKLSLGKSETRDNKTPQNTQGEQNFTQDTEREPEQSKINYKRIMAITALAFIPIITIASIVIPNLFKDKNTQPKAKIICFLSSRRTVTTQPTKILNTPSSKKS